MKKIVYFFLLGMLILTACAKRAATPEEWNLLIESGQTVDQIVQDELARLEKLSETEEAKSGNWDVIKAALTKDEEKRPRTLYWYCLPDGSYYTSAEDKVSAKLNTRGYFPALLAGENVVGYPIVGKTSGRKSFVVAVPIKVGDKITGFLGSSIYLSEMWDFLKDQISIPANYDFYAVNSAGITMFDLETKDFLLDDVLNQNSPSLIEAIRTIISNPKGTVYYKWNDKNKIAIFYQSPVSDWRYVLSFY
ncbi:MAG TPA: cache domain-containing protein [Candidatus Cloacimonadota bacterium]|nr:cache domain-containing protein [Candidatus Cloacimonadota bacterium]